MPRFLAHLLPWPATHTTAARIRTNPGNVLSVPGFPSLGFPRVVGRTFPWLNQFRRLRVRYEKRADIHEAFLVSGCILICWKFLRASRVAIPQRLTNSSRIPSSPMGPLRQLVWPNSPNPPLSTRKTLARAAWERAWFSISWCRLAMQEVLDDKSVCVATSICVAPDDITTGIDTVRVSRDRIREINGYAIVVTDD